MKDKKFRVMCILGIVWALLFLVTMRVKAPMLEGVEVLVSFTCVAWFAYWTLSSIFGKTPTVEKVQPQTESEQSNASTPKNTPTK